MNQPLIEANLLIEDDELNVTLRQIRYLVRNNADTVTVRRYLDKAIALSSGLSANVAEMATILSTGSALNLRAGDWTIRTTVVAAERDSEPAE